jgi:hypothetical protein
VKPLLPSLHLCKNNFYPPITLQVVRVTAQPASLRLPRRVALRPLSAHNSRSTEQRYCGSASSNRPLMRSAATVANFRFLSDIGAPAVPRHLPAIACRRRLDALQKPWRCSSSAIFKRDAASRVGNAVRKSSLVASGLRWTTWCRHRSACLALPASPFATTAIIAIK